MAVVSMYEVRSWYWNLIDADQQRVERKHQDRGHWVMHEIGRSLCGPDDCDAVIWRNRGWRTALRSFLRGM